MKELCDNNDQNCNDTKWKSKENILKFTKNTELISAGVQTDCDSLITSPESDSFLPSPDIDIEEIILHKSCSKDNLGFSISYSSDDTDMFTEVYVKSIEPHSIAAKDGRLKQGDQILQVNGRDVSSKEETENLLAEHNNDVTLLISRYLYDDPDFIGDNDTLQYDCDSTLSETGNCYSSSSQSTNYFIKPTKSIENINPHNFFINDPLNHVNIKAHIDSVNQEIKVLNNRMENVLKLTSISKRVAQTNRTDDPILESQSNEIEHIYETIPEYAEMEPIYCSPYETQAHSQNIIEQWIKLNQNIQKCKEQNILRDSPNSVSGENEIGNNIINTSILTSSSQLVSEFDSNKKLETRLCPSNCTCQPNILTENNSSVQIQSKSPYLTSQTMYTNVANLQQTMQLQQKLFRQALNSQLLNCRNSLCDENKDSSNNFSPRKRYTAPNLSQYQFVGSRQVSIVLKINLYF